MMERRYRKSKSHADRLTWIQQLKVTVAVNDSSLLSDSQPKLFDLVRAVTQPGEPSQ